MYGFDDRHDVAQDGAGKIGFTWRFLNLNHFKPIFHSKHYRRLQKKDGGSQQPFDTVMIEDTLRNLWCENRRENGIVCAT